jgi:hypothetical protein
MRMKSQVETVTYALSSQEYSIIEVLIVYIDRFTGMENDWEG